MAKSTRAGCGQSSEHKVSESTLRRRADREKQESQKIRDNKAKAKKKKELKRRVARDVTYRQEIALFSLKITSFRATVRALAFSVSVRAVQNGRSSAKTPSTERMDLATIAILPRRNASKGLPRSPGLGRHTSAFLASEQVGSVNLQ
jgi:hypothetical protein